MRIIGSRKARDLGWVLIDGIQDQTKTREWCCSVWNNVAKETRWFRDIFWLTAAGPRSCEERDKIVINMRYRDEVMIKRISPE